MSVGTWVVACIFVLVGLFLILAVLVKDDWIEKLICLIIGLFFYSVVLFDVSVDTVGRGNPRTYLDVGHYNVVLCRRVEMTVDGKDNSFHDCWVKKKGGSQSDLSVKWLRIPKEADKSWSELPGTFAPGSEIEIFEYNDEVRVRGTSRVVN